MTKKAASTILLATLIALSLCLTSFTTAQQSEPIVIKADGSVTGTSNIQRNGNIYTLTGNISGGIQVQKSYITIDGAGYTVEDATRGIDLGNGVGQDPSRPSIRNVTITNLKIINCDFAISSENSNNNTFIGNYIENCDTGFWIIGSGNNLLLQNTVKNCTTGISINYSSGGNVIIENNILSSLSVWLSPDPAVDRNYWGDYITRFPNAQEIRDTGVWDTPYSQGDKIIDYHPLTDPLINFNQDTSFEGLPYDHPAITILSPTPTGTVASADVSLNGTVQTFMVLVSIVTLVAVCSLLFFRKLKPKETT